MSGALATVAAEKLAALRIELIEQAYALERQGRLDAADVGPVRHQPLGEGRADEPGDAGDERLHRSKTSLARAGSRAGLPFRSSDACTVCPSATVAASTGRTTRPGSSSSPAAR